MVVGTASALYDSESGWPLLRRAIKEAQSGYADTFFKLADDYTGRNPNGTYPNNEYDSGAIIDCLDFKDSRTVKEFTHDVSEFSKVAPIFGPYLAYSGVACNFFTEANKPPHISNITTANPVVVIGTTRDPATPYAWAQGLHSILTNSTLISFKGDGHTGQGRGNSCVDDAVDRFLLADLEPAQGLTCS
jgi:hypothetical protein